MNRVLLIFAALILTTSLSFAQKDLKIGHINSNVLVQQMPEFEQAQKELQKHAKDLESALGEMQTELQTKYQNYSSRADSLTPLLRQAKEEEITELQRRMENF